MDSVALFSWIGWLRHHGIFKALGVFLYTKQKMCSTICQTHDFNYYSTRLCNLSSSKIGPVFNVPSNSAAYTFLSALSWYFSSGLIIDAP